MSDWHNLPNVRDRLSRRQDVGRLKLNFFISTIMVGMVLNGYDGTLVGGLQTSPIWHEDLGNPSSVKIGVLNASGYISGLIVGPIIQYIDDHFGRKWGIRFYSYSILLGSIVGALAGLPGQNGFGLFIAGRLIIGLGLASFLMTSLVVVQEIPHPRSRSTIAHSWNSYWILGSVINSWVNFGCSYLNTSWQWRLPYILQIGPAVYLLVATHFMPDTPRFLLGKGREEEAFDFLVKYHGNGDRDDPLVNYEFAEIKHAIELEREAKAEKWVTILRQRSNLHRVGLAVLMTFCLSFSGASIIYYYYSVVFASVGITDNTTQTGLAAGFSMFTWVTQIAGVLVGKKAGRKTILLWIWPTLLLSLIGLCVSSRMYGIGDEVNNKAGIATVAMVWVYLGFYNFANPVLWSYPSEVQTFSMRTKGMLVWNTANQIFGIYTMFVDSVALDKIGWKYYIVYMPGVIIEFFLIYYFMVETKGYTLEEISGAFDGSTVNLVSSSAYASAPLYADGQASPDFSSHKGRELEEAK